MSTSRSRPRAASALEHLLCYSRVARCGPPHGGRRRACAGTWCAPGRGVAARCARQLGVAPLARELDPQRPRAIAGRERGGPSHGSSHVSGGMTAGTGVGLLVEEGAPPASSAVDEGMPGGRLSTRSPSVSRRLQPTEAATIETRIRCVFAARRLEHRTTEVSLESCVPYSRPCSNAQLVQDRVRCQEAYG
jgi:hypothetical protein